MEIALRRYYIYPSNKFRNVVNRRQQHQHQQWRQRWHRHQLWCDGGKCSAARARNVCCSSHCIMVPLPFQCCHHRVHMPQPISCLLKLLLILFLTTLLSFKIDIISDDKNRFVPSLFAIVNTFNSSMAEHIASVWQRLFIRLIDANVIEFTVMEENSIPKKTALSIRENTNRIATAMNYN